MTKVINYGEVDHKENNNIPLSSKIQFYKKRNDELSKQIIEYRKNHDKVVSTSNLMRLQSLKLLTEIRNSKSQLENAEINILGLLEKLPKKIENV